MAFTGTAETPRGYSARENLRFACSGIFLITLMCSVSPSVMMGVTYMFQVNEKDASARITRKECAVEGAVVVYLIGIGAFFMALGYEVAGNLGSVMGLVLYIAILTMGAMAVLASKDDGNNKKLSERNNGQRFSELEAAPETDAPPIFPQRYWWGVLMRDSDCILKLPEMHRRAEGISLPQNGDTSHPPKRGEVSPCHGRKSIVTPPARMTKTAAKSAATMSQNLFWAHRMQATKTHPTLRITVSTTVKMTTDAPLSLDGEPMTFRKDSSPLLNHTPLKEAVPKQKGANPS